MATIQTQPHASSHDAIEHHDMGTPNAIEPHLGSPHPPFLGHHWDNPKQQFEAGKLGMWLFLATEVLLFGGLFVGYSVWRHNHPELFAYGSNFLDTRWGAINTIVLILSSLTMAWGVTAAQKNQQGLLKLMLVLTLCGAAGFLVIKYFEYSHKLEQGWRPGAYLYTMPHHSESFEEGEIQQRDREAQAALMDKPFKPTLSEELPPTAEASNAERAPMGPAGLNEAALTLKSPLIAERGTGEHIHPVWDGRRPKDVQMFFSIYFMMTGLHGVHVVAGGIVILWLLIRAVKGHFSSEYFTPVDLGGLYWHVVDLIWIFLFPLFYLI